MSIESAIERLAAAVEHSASSSAVTEIIRQRDKALTDLENVRNFYAWEKNHTERLRKQVASLKQSVAAYKGAATRRRKESLL